MKIRKTKKGFTIVELVIVIAVIGVLTAILVPTFISLTAKANKASDQSLVANLNTALKMQEAEDGAKNPTMHDAVLDLAEQGFDLGKLVTKSKEALLWNSETNQFELEKDQAGAKFWKIYDAAPTNSTVSVYAKGNNFGATVNVEGVGFDAGYVTSISTVNYTGGTAANDVVIRTAGDQTVLTVDAPKDNIDFYGFAKRIDVAEIASSSLHIYGAVNELSVTKGHVEIEDTGIVFSVTALDTSDATNPGKITNGGYIAEAATAEIKSAIESTTGSKVVGGDYEINSLARLEAFRDVVNSGNNFDGKTVKLTADITLKDGWTPIGEGNRDVAATNISATGLTTYFAGTFDGQNHTISNLNNKDFVPTSSRIINGNQKQYAYGLFALVQNATFRNIKLTNVDFDSSRYSGAPADSVGALIGYSRGNLTVENVTVSGSIKGLDAISGIVGRITIGANTVIIDGCTNNANITSDSVASGIARIYRPESGHVCTLSNNTNNGNVVSLDTVHNYYGGISVYNIGVNVTNTNNTNKGNAATRSELPGNNYRLD